MPEPSVPSQAELSSISTALDELTARLTAMADALVGTEREGVATELYEVERSLRTATTRLGRLTG